MKAAREQKAAVEAIVKLGGTVVYDYQKDASSTPRANRPARRGCGSCWATIFSSTVTKVNLSVSKITDAGLQNVEAVYPTPGA